MNSNNILIKKKNIKNNIFNFNPKLEILLENSINKLKTNLKNNTGRNNKGQTIFFHRNKTRYKRIYSYIDFWRNLNTYGYIVSIKYDPRRSSFINLICYINGILVNSIAVENVFIGKKIFSGSLTTIINSSIVSLNLLERKNEITTSIGNSIELFYIPIGSKISLIEIKKNTGAKICRAAGTFATIFKKTNNEIVIKLISGKKLTLQKNCIATIGVVSNSLHKYKLLKKAGKARNLGYKPIVRGVAMNAVDHPHGGGRGKSRIDKKPLSPWGKLTKWVKTSKSKKI